MLILREIERRHKKASMSGYMGIRTWKCAAFKAKPTALPTAPQSQYSDSSCIKP